MWDRERKFSELIDEKTRGFFRDVVEEACFSPWSLWEKEGLILSAKRMEAGYPETVLGPRMAEWFQLTDGGEQPDHFETERGLCLAFPVRYDFDIAGVLVIGPVAEENALSHMRAMGKLLAGLTELMLWTNLKQALMIDAQSQIMAFSYEEAVQKNKELEESEGRYRELAESLEVKVAEKTAELKEAYVKLLQADKMASIGQLAAGIAHEINNPLAFIKSNINTSFQMTGDLIEKIKICKAVNADLEGGSDPRLNPLKEIFAAQAGEDLNILLEDFQSLVSETLDGIARVQKIVSDLKEFSHVDDAAVNILDIHKSLDATLSVLAHKLRAGIKIVRRYGDNIPPVKCHPHQISQVFMNVILNAIQAIKDKGETIISTVFVNGAVKIEISDTGCGIPPDHLPRIFDPFFTTKPVGQGTGTGLSVCYEVIKAHGGTIEAASEAGKGTVITIVLPV
ncbi:MAG: ATP-binding protein [Thermodesulfobacteriota bacterium]|nr:ATP-binding protein [Thermodesulfobacteriota bacterium]